MSTFLKKWLFNSINNISIAAMFISATKINDNDNIIYGIIAYIIAFICLDLHSYIEKQLGYPNNLFINS